MTNEKIEELQKLAEAATDGPWAVGETYIDQEEDGTPCMPETVVRGMDMRAAVAVCLDFGDNNPLWRDINAAFIAAANPAVIKELLSELTTLRAMASDFQKMAEVLGPDARRANSDAVHPSPRGRQVMEERLRAAASAPKAELTDELTDREVFMREFPNVIWHEGAPYPEESGAINKWQGWRAKGRAVLAQAAPVAGFNFDGFRAELRRQAEHTETYGSCAEAARIAFDCAVDALDEFIDAAPAAPVAAAVPAGWVSVAERLPENGAQVLIYTPNARTFKVWIDERYDGGWNDWNDSEVSHWAPLPAAPAQETAS